MVSASSPPSLRSSSSPSSSPPPFSSGGCRRTKVSALAAPASRRSACRRLDPRTMHSWHAELLPELVTSSTSAASSSCVACPSSWTITVTSSLVPALAASCSRLARKPRDLGDQFSTSTRSHLVLADVIKSPLAAALGATWATAAASSAAWLPCLAACLAAWAAAALRCTSGTSAQSSTPEWARSALTQSGAWLASRAAWAR
mmetsp:Transcript_41489/g.93550  ORF Transcript_41489/g.93550 Transcript_41489/m.93550 type:complete len:202 (+) Transcript_41489:961-1566(+)